MHREVTSARHIYSFQFRFQCTKAVLVLRAINRFKVGIATLLQRECKQQMTHYSQQNTRQVQHLFLALYNEARQMRNLESLRLENVGCEELLRITLTRV